MTFLVLVSARRPDGPTPPRRDSRVYWLESWDGSVKMPINGDSRLRMLVGHTGLGVAPTDLELGGTPGVPGGRVEEVTTLAREVQYPLAIYARDEAEHLELLDQLRDLTDPENGMTPDGNFRLVCSSPSGVRQVGLAYRRGLEGNGYELPHRSRMVMTAVAPQPYGEDREVQSRQFRLVSVPQPFLSTPGTDKPWGTRKLSSSQIAGPTTPIELFSRVPVYLVVELTGPADSVLITGSNGLRIDVSAGVEAGETLRIVTNPRGDGTPPYQKTIRSGSTPSAGRISTGSRFVPFRRGVTNVDVAAPGATADTLLRLSWRGLHRGLW